MQSYNRYSYVLNNPLSNTDSSGYFLDWFTALLHAFELFAGEIAWAAASSVPAWAASATYAATMGTVYGLAAGALGGVASMAFGGSFADGFQAGFQMGFTSGIYSFIGSHGFSATYGATGTGLGQGITVQRIIAHGLVGGTTARINGGQFAHGFTSGAFTKSFAAIIGSSGLVRGTIISAVVGGTISELTGGKFANGAYSGAFGYMYNQMKASVWGFIVNINEEVAASGGWGATAWGWLAADVVDAAKAVEKGNVKVFGQSAFKAAFKPVKLVANLVDKVCCFVAGTKVYTIEGYRNIENIKVGDWVWSKNVETGEQDWKRVTHTFVKRRTIFELTVANESQEYIVLETTNDHPYWVPEKGWINTEDLQQGDEIETDGYGLVSVLSVNSTKRVDIVYNLEVEDYHTYYATESNILVHNCAIKVLGNLKGMPLKEAKQLMSKWDKATYDTLSDSIRDHAKRHGFGDDIPKYLRKAANFNKKGALKKILEDGAVRWNRQNGEFLIERAGKIVTYGINK